MLGHCSLWHVHLSEIRTVSVQLHPQRAEAKPAPKKRAPRKKKTDADTAAEAPADETEKPAEDAKPKRTRRKAPAKKAAPKEEAEDNASVEPAAPANAEQNAEQPDEPAAPKRGWWQRTFGDE